MLGELRWSYNYARETGYFKLLYPALPGGARAQAAHQADLRCAAVQSNGDKEEHRLMIV
jgi:hypothetical protein